jgi:ABC-type nitrate/sulfonate/bicarbonate transport system permease component
MTLRLASIAGAIVLWWVLSLVMPANLLPGPVVATVTLAKDFVEGDVLPHLAITSTPRRLAGSCARGSRLSST